MNTEINNKYTELDKCAYNLYYDLFGVDYAVDIDYFVKNKITKNYKINRYYDHAKLILRKQKLEKLNL